MAAILTVTQDGLVSVIKDLDAATAKKIYHKLTRRAECAVWEKQRSRALVWGTIAYNCGERQAPFENGWSIKPSQEQRFGFSSGSSFWQAPHNAVDLISSKDQNNVAFSELHKNSVWLCGPRYPAHNWKVVEMIG